MKLRRIVAGSVACCLIASAASAALVPSLASVTPVSGGYQYNYTITLTGDEGLSPAAYNPPSNSSITSQLAIFDFAGYVAGSIASSNPLFTPDAELVTPGLPELVGATDDPTLINLHFTYNGTDYHTTGGPYANMTVATFSAISTFAATGVSDFSSAAVNNTATNGAAVGTAAFNQASITVPIGSVPEPASWAMMLGGFGLLGAALRRRRVPTLFA